MFPTFRQTHVVHDALYKLKDRGLASLRCNMLYNYGSNRQDETARAWPWEDHATICALLAQAEDWPLAKEDVHCTHEWTWVRTETYVLAQGQMPVIKASYNAQDFL